jgi:hypothetical protein
MQIFYLDHKLPRQRAESTSENNPTRE